MTTTTTMTVTAAPSDAKPLFIYLEGVDRSGKDSMQDAIDRATKYRHIITDRGPIGFKAYCDIFHKSEELYAAYDLMEKQLESMDNVLVIYLTASNEELVDRCIGTNHEILDFELHKTFYEHHLKCSNLRKITVDTTYKHVNEIAEDLVKEGIL